jgi:tetratricopeptide (TPR) repeat protein
MKKRIDIKSKRNTDLSTKVVISDRDFLVETELNGKTRPIIKSRIYREGEIVSTYKQELDNVTDKASIRELMLEHHQLSIEAMKEELHTPEIIPAHNALLDTIGNIEEALDMLQTKCPSNDATGNIELSPDTIQPKCASDNTAGCIKREPEILPMLYSLNHVAQYIDEPRIPMTSPSNLTSECSIDASNEAPETTGTEIIPEDTKENNIMKEQKPKKSPSDYLKETNILLARKSLSSAMGLISEGIDNHPNSPPLLSLYGYLTVKVKKNYRKGLLNCNKAIELVKRRVPFNPALAYPNFFLNLGRAYVAAGDRKHAIDTFMKVLYVDEDNTLVRMEMQRLGTRKKPFIAFLRRSNPLNKYAGLIICRLRIRAA